AEGVEFLSETDTEVAAAQLAKNYRATGDLTAAMRATASELEGAFTLLAVHADVPGQVVAARRNSPLVIGLGEGENFLGSAVAAAGRGQVRAARRNSPLVSGVGEGQNFLASDGAAFIDYTRSAVEIGQDEVVTITSDEVTITDIEGNLVEGEQFEVDWDTAAAEKGGFASFMDKEIHDQPQAVADTLLGRLDTEGRLTLDEMRIDESVLKSIDKIVVIACGTAAYAGQVAKYAIEHWCRIPTEVELAHEFR